MLHFTRSLLTSYPQKQFWSSIALSLHTLSLSHTTLTNKSHIKYRVHKIEHNYNQIWQRIKAKKNIFVNCNFTISPFGHSMTKLLKQILDLNMSLEQWQNSLTPNLEAMKHLHVYTCNLKHSHTNKTFIKLMTS